ncbi:MAG: hypothetical protein KA388_08685 [Rhodocyclaceae bacterium]|nr:hypothetical protein [Rhodocyclaceae bacterium]
MRYERWVDADSRIRGAYTALPDFRYPDTATASKNTKATPKDGYEVQVKQQGFEGGGMMLVDLPVGAGDTPLALKKSEESRPIDKN